MTHANASMVEETDKLSQALAAEANALKQLVPHLSFLERDISAAAENPAFVTRK